MARLFGIIGNRADLMARVFAAEGASLTTKAKGVPLGWGLGFYQGGEVLILLELQQPASPGQVT